MKLLYITQIWMKLFRVAQNWMKLLHLAEIWMELFPFNQGWFRLLEFTQFFSIYGNTVFLISPKFEWSCSKFLKFDWGC